MTELFATDTDEEEKELPPLKVEVTNKDKPEIKNPTSEDTEFREEYIPTEEEIKEMTDAQ